MTWRRLGLVYLALLVLSMLLTRFLPPAPLALSSGVAPLTGVVDRIAANLRGAWNAVVFERDLKLENARLRATNEELEAQNRRLKLDLERYKKAAQILESQSPGLLTVASVTAIDPSPLLSRLTVNAGAERGVTRFMPATVPAGLVGLVVEVNRTSAVVLTLVDPEFRAGVTLEGKGGTGTAIGAPPDRLRVEFSKNVDVQVGDTVQTASIGGVYPAGIKIGTVENVLPLGANATTRTVIVKPAVDVSTLQEVGLLRPL
ncbi:rod shape-determining protein MreC [Deinobacterium chartae]|uniref:Cell shape-determining protein MreC n=1 Tax=Deinobacterium chartae TaxID=521158 RepID=A0A841HWU6_9DEIO|nr:rod shape-determining protein MreC [Deinobacterium chartae]MBB6097114.1 rod shape-determining protein MreC [Deinobacterium chartae]